MSDSLDSAYAAQLDLLFNMGNVQRVDYYRASSLLTSFDAVVGAFPTRLTGVNPGDLRVRARADSLAPVSGAGASTVTLRLLGRTYAIVAAFPEFNGLGVTFQVRVATGAQSNVGATYDEVPQATLAERDALGNGLQPGTMIFQTDNTPGLRVWNGANWVRFTETID